MTVEKTSTIMDNLQSYLEKAITLMDLNSDIKRIITHSENEIEINFPVKLDSGDIEMFSGFRVQHNDLLGPYIGGIRFHPHLSLKEVRELASWTTWQSALYNIPMGGSKGGIKFNPIEHSFSELERITRRFTFALSQNLGPEYDIITPDINTNSQIMAWILDTYLSTMPAYERNRSFHVVTGKPIASGGCQGYYKSTGKGIMFCIKEWSENRNFNLKDTTFIVQGFGNIGTWASKFLSEEGARLIAVEDSTGAIKVKNRIDPHELSEHKRMNKTLTSFSKSKQLSHEEFMKTEADIFIAAALENQINEGTAPEMNVKLVVEGANSPTTPEGDEILRDRDIEVIPDIICNAGSLIASYFEWLQNKRSEFWEIEEITSGLRRKISETYEKAINTAIEYKTDLRTASYISALNRLETVYRERGIFP